MWRSMVHTQPRSKLTHTADLLVAYVKLVLDFQSWSQWLSIHNITPPHPCNWHCSHHPCWHTHQRRQGIEWAGTVIHPFAIKVVPLCSRFGAHWQGNLGSIYCHCPAVLILWINRGHQPHSNQPGPFQTSRKFIHTKKVWTGLLPCCLLYSLLYIRNGLYSGAE